MQINISREDIERAKSNKAKLIESMSKFLDNAEMMIFKKGFDENIKEYFVLTEGSANIEKNEKATLWNARFTAGAVIDLENRRFYDEKINLEWLMTDQQKEDNMLFGFEGDKIYRIKARESTSEGIKRLMVCEVVERDCSESSFKAAIAENN